MTLTTKLRQGTTGLQQQEQPPGTIHIVQITDTHLYARPQGTLLGVNTLESFRQVIAQIQSTDWPCDLVLATGDLVHDASPTGYRQLAGLLAEFDAPVYCLPGNHDLPDIMQRHLQAAGVTTTGAVDAGGWRIVMLDSVIPGEPGGHLATSELDRLAAELDATSRHVLVCLHHQPVAVGSAWMDTMALDNAARFFDIIDRRTHVRGILWGHVHQTFDTWRGAVRLLASPSTCVQFTPGKDAFSIDQEPPGFRLLALRPDGAIQTEVIRVADMPGGLDLASAGY